MLVLSRKVNEEVVVGSDVTVRVLSLNGGVVKLGIEAPQSVPVHRREVYERLSQGKKTAVAVDLG